MTTTYYMQARNGHIFAVNDPDFWKDCTRLPQKRGKEMYKEQSRQLLLGILKPGSRVYTSLKTVARSGMSRTMKLFCVNSNGEICDITYHVCIVTGNKYTKGGTLSVSGCGMDMGFHVVYGLGRRLWPNGTPEAHGIRNGEPDFDGGYALKYTWL